MEALLVVMMLAKLLFGISEVMLRLLLRLVKLLRLILGICGEESCVLGIMAKYSNY